MLQNVPNALVTPNEFSARLPKVEIFNEFSKRGQFHININVDSCTPN